MSPIIQPKIQPSNEKHSADEAEKATLRAELLKMILRRELDRKDHAVPPRFDHSQLPEPHIAVSR
jgi:hypothetical protein